MSLPATVAIVAAVSALLLLFLSNSFEAFSRVEYVRAGTAATKEKQLDHESVALICEGISEILKALHHLGLIVLLFSGAGAIVMPFLST